MLGRGEKPNKKKGVITESAAVDRSNQVQTHVSIPPLVKGRVQGHLRVCVSRLRWEYSIGPPAPKLCVRLKWWGEKSQGILLRVPVQTSPSSSSTSGGRRRVIVVANFPVCTGWSQLKAYLRDMGFLRLDVGLGHMTDSSTVIGWADFASPGALTPTTALERDCPVVSPDGIKFGRLHVGLSYSNQKATTEGNPQPLQRLKATAVDSPKMMMKKGYSKDTSSAVAESSILIPDASSKCGIDDKRSDVGWREVGRGEEEEEEEEEARVKAVQLQVISDLIEKGQRLREAMVQASVKPWSTDGVSAITNLPGNHEDSSGPHLEGLLPLELLETRRKSSHKRKELEGSLGIDKRLMELVVGKEEERDGVMDLSSEEDSLLEEQGRAEEPSLSDPDHPLCDLSLLNGLIYLEDGEDGTRKSGFDRPSSSSVEEPIPCTTVAGSNQQRLECSSAPVGEGWPVMDDLAAPNDGQKSSTVVNPGTGSHSVAQRVVDTEGADSQGGGGVPENGAASGPAGGLDSLSAFFSSSSSSLGGGESLESAILHSLGMEALTRLGGVTSARVVVQSLQVEVEGEGEGEGEGLRGTAGAPRGCAAKRKQKTGHLNSSNSATYFVEYHFPASVVTMGHVEASSLARKRRPVPSHEVMRIASKKMKNGVVDFNHRSVFPVRFSSEVVRQWWHSALVFRVYCRPPTKRLPFLVGKAVLPLKQCLIAAAAGGSGGDCPGLSFPPEDTHGGPRDASEGGQEGGGTGLQYWTLDVKQSTSSSSVMPPVRDNGEDPVIIGKLQVCLKLVGPRGGVDRLLTHNSSSHPHSTHRHHHHHNHHPHPHPHPHHPHPISNAVDFSSAVLGAEKGDPRQQAGHHSSSVAAADKRQHCLSRDEPTLLSAPIHLREEEPTSRLTQDSSKPSVLHLLLYIPEGTGVTSGASVPTSRFSGDPQGSPLHSLPAASGSLVLPSLKPNPYLVCKLFCTKPSPRAAIQWGTTEPQFGFKQTYSVYLTPALLHQMCNNFAVVEVWHKTPGTTTDDELLGLVKLSLHQFYLAYSEESSTDLFHSSELPVIAVDCYCPIVNPFSAVHCGHLAVLLALGTPKQVTVLQQQVMSGVYQLERPHSMRRKGRREGRDTSLEPEDHEKVVSRTSERQEGTKHGRGGITKHEFQVIVEGVSGLSVFQSSIWGEADCFVQYHFPSQQDEGEEGEEGEEEGEEGEGEREEQEGDKLARSVVLMPQRTGTVLCVPEPSFNQEFRHAISLQWDSPIQKALVSACGGSSEIPFELWRRFYYPNIRDQLVGKACLPLAKLCAMVTMQKTASANSQFFSLPLKEVTHTVGPALGTSKQETRSGGVLDVTIKYRCRHLEGGEGEEGEDDGRRANAQGAVDNEGISQVQLRSSRSQVNLLLGVLRATGLKDAVQLATLSQPVPLEFASEEAGINAYVAATLPVPLRKDKLVTKAVARTFSPEFSHFFDISLPLAVDHAPSDSDSTHHHAPPSSQRVPLAEVLAGGRLVMEVWHQVPRSEFRPASLGCERQPFGRKLGPTFRDALLGCVEIPLVDLLRNHTGIHGWFALRAPQSHHLHVHVPISSGSSGAKPPNETSQLQYVGGMELTLAFTREEDRELVLSHAAAMTGWSLPPNNNKCLVPPKLMSREGEKGGRSESREGSDDKNRANSTTCASAVSSPGKCKWWRLDVVVGGAWVPLEVVTVVGSDESPTYNYLYLRYKFFEEAATAVGSAASVEPGSSGGHTDTPNHRKSSVDQEKLKDVFEAHVVIGQALHLPTVCDRSRKLQEGLPNPYVALHPHPSVEKVTTRVVSGSTGPVWDHRCTTHIPNLYMEQQSLGLEFQVWSSSSSHHSSRGEGPGAVPPTPPSPAGTAAADSTAVTAAAASEAPRGGGGGGGGGGGPVQGERDLYIGSAHVDLSALAYGMQWIHGWYNIVNFGGQIQGQLNVSVVPTKGQNHPQVHEAWLWHSSLGSIPPLVTSREFMPPPSSLLGDEDGCLGGSKTSSLLFQELRRNICDLDKIRDTLQAKLRDSETQKSESREKEESSFLFKRHGSDGLSPALVSIPPLPSASGRQAFSSVTEQEGEGRATYEMAGGFCSLQPVEVEKHGTEVEQESNSGSRGPTPTEQLDAGGGNEGRLRGGCVEGDPRSTEEMDDVGSSHEAVALSSPSSLASSFSSSSSHSSAGAGMDTSSTLEVATPLENTATLEDSVTVTANVRDAASEEESGSERETEPKCANLEPPPVPASQPSRSLLSPPSTFTHNARPAPTTPPIAACTSTDSAPPTSFPPRPPHGHTGPTPPTSLPPRPPHGHTGPAPPTSLPPQPPHGHTGPAPPTSLPPQPPHGHTGPAPPTSLPPQPPHGHTGPAPPTSLPPTSGHTSTARPVVAATTKTTNTRTTGTSVDLKAHQSSPKTHTCTCTMAPETHTLAGYTPETHTVADHTPILPQESKQLQDSKGASSTGQRRLRPAAPSVELPNFFMPPGQLEETLRSMRSSVLTMLPPRTGPGGGGGGGGGGLAPPGRRRDERGTESLLGIGRVEGTDPEEKRGSATLPSVRTLKEIENYLASRRTENVSSGSATVTAADQDGIKKLDGTEMQRIARIFSSKPT